MSQNIKFKSLVETEENTVDNFNMLFDTKNVLVKTSILNNLELQKPVSGSIITKFLPANPS